MDENIILMKRTKENEECVESSDAQEDIWDDSLLIKAYERAISLAKAKKDQITSTTQNSEATNQTSEPKDSSFANKNNNKKIKKVQKSGQNTGPWKVGMKCRSVYTEDGVEYEAVIIQMMEWKGKCVVHYIGYNNEEEVNIDRLKPSKGEAVREKQIAEAACQMDLEENEENNEELPEENIQNRTKFLPFQAGAGMLPPPPPPHIMMNLPKTETEALSAMLMSWYMSGYHTGYYFGLANSNSRQMCDSQKMDLSRHKKKK